MKICNIVLAFSALFVLTETVLAQSRDFIKAEDAFKACEYYTAADLYRTSYSSLSQQSDKSGKTKAEILFKIAECYRLVNEPVKAELWYVKSLSKDTTAKALYFLAQAQKMNLKYEAAKDNFKKYKTKFPGDARADEGIRSCEQAQSWMSNQNGYTVENMRFFNSKSRDYCPAYGAADYSVVYFTSSREGSTGKAIHGATGQLSADIYVSKIDKKGTWSKPVLVKGTVNTEFDEGSPCFSKDFKTMYFTRCKRAKNTIYGCQIMEATQQGEEWTSEKPIDIAKDSIVVAHPAISPDELTLYFTSDMPGGKGGKDIWKVTRSSKGDDWGKPVNLGPQINTSGDEMFPYVHADGTLYFSSNGMTGMGGLDIFKATPQPNNSWKVENMGYPINSNADDFGIIFQDEQEKGYLSSSRSPRNDDDIYAFFLPPVKFSASAKIIEEKSNKPLADVNVKVISSDGLTYDLKTDKDGNLNLNLKPNTDYVFIASKDGYLNGKDRQTTKGIDKSRDFKVSIAMVSIAKPIELPNIFYDFAKWDLRPESMVALDKLVETLNDNPNITIELMSHSDARGNEADNLVLSQKRAQSVVNYLVEKGIAAERLVAKGYGKTVPKVVDKKLSEQHNFLKEGDVLNEAFIGALPDAALQDVAHQINRRTEFKVLRTDYKKK
ncbi:MAG: OmpA family protein [Bacteroidota bacterium]|nr:OmpA family protein [Bacteroidota bacterium]